MKLFVKDKSFYRALFSMAGVIAMQNLITYAVNLADNVMIGSYSQDALSGVALVNQIQFLLQMVVMGIGNGIVVLGAQYWGRRQIDPQRGPFTPNRRCSRDCGGHEISEDFLFLICSVCHH